MAAKYDVLDPKAKAARQKKIAIIGGVVLVALLAYQVPKTMKMLNPPPPRRPVAAAPAPVPATPTPTPAGTTPAATAPGTAQPAGTATPASADAIVVNADVSPVPLDGQLASFTRFTSKDPFQQQGGTASASTPSGSSKSPGSSSKTPKAPPATPGGAGAVPPSGSNPTPTAPTPAPQSATLSVNGVPESVSVNADFPAAAPLFHLVALTATTAKIAIAGGSLASGAPTVTLRLGKPLTLMNTADGTRYLLILKPLGTSVPTAKPATAAATTTVPVPPAAP